MSRSVCVFGIVFLVLANSAITAQEAQTDTVGDSELGQILPGFRDQALVLDINARVVEENQMVVWNEMHHKITIPGRPVGIRLVGANIIVAVQFTPYCRRMGQNLLVAQGQIWMDVPNQGIRYQTSMQTIPLAFNEPVYFFPLGPGKDGNTSGIEILLTMRPYRDAALPAESGAPSGGATSGGPNANRRAGGASGGTAPGATPPAPGTSGGATPPAPAAQE